MVRERLLEVLCKCDACTIDELATKLSDIALPEIRKELSELVREGIVEKKPDYSSNKLVFSVKSGYCSSRFL